MAREADISTSTGARGFAVVGLLGETLLTVLEELTELSDSLGLAREKIECVELISVLELLPGSLLRAGRIGVEGLIGSGKPLVRRCWVHGFGGFSWLTGFSKGGGLLPLILV